MSMKILIVEDDPAIQLMYKMKLEGAGYNIQTANDGEEGLRACKEFLPDLILLDLRMPIMSGDEMLKALRETEWGASIRVIVLTNVSRDEAPSSLRLLDVDRYLVKAHHTPTQVVEIVDEVAAA